MRVSTPPCAFTCCFESILSDEKKKWTVCQTSSAFALWQICLWFSSTNPYVLHTFYNIPFISATRNCSLGVFLVFFHPSFNSRSLCVCIEYARVFYPLSRFDSIISTVCFDFELKIQIKFCFNIICLPREWEKTKESCKTELHFKLMPFASFVCSGTGQNIDENEEAGDQANERYGKSFKESIPITQITY